MVLRFLSFELDPDCRELRDQGALVSLSPKSFDVLCYLVEHRDRMVSKSELLDAFWSSQVTEAALQKAISLLRKATRCDGNLIIRTYHGLGFRFVPEMSAPSGSRLPLKDEPPAPLQERRLVSVLCLRFDADASCDGSIVERFLDQARASVEAHQGEALRMTLDGFTASFGLKTLYEDAVRRAVHCAVELIAAGQKIDGISPIIGIDYGPVDLSESAENLNWRRPSDIERGAVELADTGQPNDLLLSKSTSRVLGRVANY